MDSDPPTSFVGSLINPCSHLIASKLSTFLKLVSSIQGLPVLMLGRVTKHVTHAHTDTHTSLSAQHDITQSLSYLSTGEGREESYWRGSSCVAAGKPIEEKPILGEEGE